MLNVSGDLWQLPPIRDNLVTDHSNLDGRPKCAPSHWQENFKIFYLTEKMRNQTDPQFAAICDRVKLGNLIQEDVDFFKSRIIECPSEMQNENFKSGKLSIIVTTNAKKDLINREKLEKLLPNEPVFECNSIDRSVNLPVENKLPECFKRNAGKTGNLETQLRLKVGAPVVITVNHSKRKYREDGIINGSRGYVSAIQVSKSDPKKVDIVWVVFNDPKIGKLYRFEHKHLRSDFNPGHRLATPILPVRKNFQSGNVEFQRQNFALSLAYALTAHKSQGWTLDDEVILDFGDDKDHNIKSYIIPGSFYVSITRVREGRKLFLKSFDLSYIKTDPRIEEKVDAMLTHCKYPFKKIYLENKIFKSSEKEVKLVYLNINGLLDANHAEYINTDKNLLNTDILVLAETKTVQSIKNDSFEHRLSHWKILKRCDADGGKKHMGLMLMSPVVLYTK